MNSVKKITVNQDSLVLISGVLLCIILTFMLVWIEPYLFKPNLLPDQGTSWYYWKLAELHFWNYLTPWVGFVMHQLIFWSLLYRAKHSIKGYSKHLNKYNWSLLQYEMSLKSVSYSNIK